MISSLKAVGVIAEYNPFHSGHAFHLQQSKSLAGADYAIVVMSGDFVQRGAPAIYDKYLRAHMALLNGADLVLEIPPAFAVSSAKEFASCAVSLLDRLGTVSHICFGSECGDIQSLANLADILFEEPASLSQSVKRHLAAGFSYPRALNMALTSCLPPQEYTDSLSSLLSSPNNVLGIEYLNAIRKRGSSIIPITVSRIGAGYHDQELDSAFSSASAVRRTIMEHQEDPQALSTLLSGQVPHDCLKLMETAPAVSADDFSELLSYCFLELQRRNVSPEIYADVSPELSARMKKQLLCFRSFEERIAALKTRQYTYTRISRCLVHILLHITAEEIRQRKQADYCSYVRILGFRKAAAPLLSVIKRSSKLPLITKTADAPQILSPQALEQFYGDLYGSHVYQSVQAQKTGKPCRNEYTRSVIVV